MASAQVVQTSVNTNNSPSQDYTTNQDDHSNHNIDSPGFKPFTVIRILFYFWPNATIKNTNSAAISYFYRSEQYEEDNIRPLRDTNILLFSSHCSSRVDKYINWLSLWMILEILFVC